MIQTLNIKARCLMLDGNVRMGFWAEAIMTATYLHQRTPTTSLNGISPHETLYGWKLTVCHMRRSGCWVYVLIPKMNQEMKFSPKATPCMMLGHVHDSATIRRLWNFEKWRAIEASNVQFLEDENAHRSIGGQQVDIVMPGDYTDTDIMEIEEESDDEYHQIANVLDIGTLIAICISC
jgi:hypothetical protein